MRYWDNRDDDLALLTLVNRALRLWIQEKKGLLAQGGESLIGTNLERMVRFITSIKTSFKHGPRVIDIIGGWESQGWEERIILSAFKSPLL